MKNIPASPSQIDPSNIEDVAPDPVGDVGVVLRNIRKEKGLRLRHIAEKTGLSVSLLSQIERGVSSPSLRVLRIICLALEVDGATLFAAPQRDGLLPTTRLREDDFVIRMSQRKSVKVGGVTKYRVTPVHCAKMDGCVMDVDVGSGSGPEFMLQTGDKIAYVLKGRLRLFLDQAEVVLEEGDVYGFPAGHHFRWENAADVVTTILVVNGIEFYV